MRTNIRLAVEERLAPLLPDCGLTRRRIARSLNMSERTLCRRLAFENTTYDKIVDELRRRLALEALARIGVQIGEIAYDLGYGSQSSFDHAFKRWMGQPPSEYRRSLRLSPGGWPLAVENKNGDYIDSFCVPHYLTDRAGA